ncbi:hypothetical protein ykris0001_36030 [Yersinia kristensenii ATCC 33638]|nr:hypothetical protein ykris0001_22440 [Yersinia kristensenii ATCC 33638]EEP93471.1 hypothetical protein ykris0001_36030 [Yersinia kristensenii ATCC 33638]
MKNLDHSLSEDGYYPKSLALQQGSKQTHPDELTQVSDSGK